MDDIDAEGYRANVGIIVADSRNAVLIGGRTGQRGWQFPQGGVRVNESRDDAMFRELGEELGLSRADVEVLGQTRGWLRYRLPEQFVRRHARPVCIGQKQRWYLLRLLTTDSRLSLDSTPKPEFDRWRWVSWWEPIREVIHFKQQVYAQAMSELAPLVFGDDVPPRPDWWQDDWDRLDDA